MGPVLGFGLLGVWALNTLYRMGVAGVFVLMWQRRKWAQIQV